MVTKNWFSRSRDPKSSEIGVIGGHNLKIFEPRHIIYQKEALGPVIKKNGFRGHPRSLDPKLGPIGLIRGQNPRILILRQIKYQNKALGLIDKKNKGFQFASFRVKKDCSTNCLERSERL